ncbi:membrane fusion protein, cobalt-zinc-cadmium efflux system [Parapedobacter composti]|uniref:Membrane fusion protein, cobalt-zinc-cadmium efflux system n=1 Tax=Parapedobacter composti TaxID=623281 RepID=A0A1I1J3D4_9SPHI|nr:efflux RND transporter periplasmic adaptor subunit [Parapedobacter composti]SFC39970.1 membrane fusion protein, cobalt-zinc-cadmium efflux system [Parapedobacter composti]
MNRTKQYCWTLVLLALSCGQREQLIEEKRDGFCLNDNLRRELVIDTAYEREVTRHIALTGEVSYNPDKVVQFVSWVEGIAVQTHFSLGEYVKKGQVLATMKSPELNLLAADAKRIEAELKAARRDLERTTGLHSDHIASEIELVQAQSAIEMLEAELAGIRSNLALFHPNPAQGVFELRSPASGYIVAKNINPGMPINDGDNLFTVSGLADVWVMANVHATDMQFVEEGLTVEIRTLGYPGEVFQGRISALSQVFDSEERVLKARIVIPNEGRKLKPGMPADITVERRSGTTAVAIPADAVIFDDNQYFAVVYGGDCDLQLRRLSLAARDNQWYFLNEGINPGERVVSRNHLLIYERIKG